MSPVKAKMTVEDDKKQHLLLEEATALGTGPGELPLEMAPQQRTPQKRLRSVDSSKFNRSARKSKNCATFYFKHLDTDGENQINGGFSSQDDYELMTEEQEVESVDGEEEEEEDEWMYTNNKLNSTVNGETPEEENKSLLVPQISISEDSVFEKEVVGVVKTTRTSLVQLVSYFCCGSFLNR